MTTVAAVIDRTNGIGYIAADTGAIVSGSTIIASPRKLIERDGYLIGTCGSTTFRAWQASQPPQPPAELWAGFFRFCREHGHGEASQGLWCGPDTAIFLTPDGLFVGLTSGVLEPVDEPFVAIGSGSAFATGAMDALLHRSIGAREALQDAVVAACRRDPYTTGPVVLRSIQLNPDRE